jgi:hypothetical protein
LPIDVSKYQSQAPSGQPTHTPKIRIAGIATGTPAYNDLVDQYRGQLNQFIGKHQQQVAVSGQRQYKASKSLPGGGRMTYQNVEGQETITLVVAPTGGEEKVQVELEEYWQWAVVELKVPTIQGLTSFEASAFIDPPPTGGKLGIALNKTFPYDADDPPISYPIDVLGTFIGDVQDNDGYASLRVDLRQYPRGIKFDLYGYIRRYQDGTEPGDPHDPQRVMWRGANAVSIGGASYTTLGGTIVPTWYAAGDISGRTQTNYVYKGAGTPHTDPTLIALAFPAATPLTFGGSPPGPYGAAWSGDGPVYAGSSLSWSPGGGGCPDSTTMNLSGLISAAGGIFSETLIMGADGVSFALRGIGAQTFQSVAGVESVLNGAGPTDSVGNWGIAFFDYTIYYIAQYDDVPVYVYPDRDCPISFVVMDEGPDGMTNRFGSPLKMNSYRWETTKKYPERWPLRVLPDLAHMPAVDPTTLPTPTTANHFGMTKLGTVIINPRKGKGGIKFIAA